jgi:DNA replication and repair protein RecF
MLQNISLQNFRNLNLKRSFQKGLNIYTAPNGAGKTNLLESIFYVCNGFSFRKNLDGDIIAHEFVGNPRYFNIVGTFDNKITKQVYFEKHVKSIKLFKINNEKVSRTNFLQDYIAVLFAPETIDILSGSPEGRRTEIDIFTALYSDKYAQTLIEFTTILKNRNRVLKSISRAECSISMIDYWNEKFITSASELFGIRLQLLDKIQTLSSELAKSMYHFGDNNFEIRYISKHQIIPNKSIREMLENVGDYRDSLREKINLGLQRELYLENTIYGPHKDDIEVYLNGKLLKNFGSRGQQRIASFVIKLAELQILENLGKNIILLLDDLQSELDNDHLIKIMTVLKSLDKTQIILTGTNDSFYL